MLKQKGMNMEIQGFFRHNSLEDVKLEISETELKNEISKVVFREVEKFIGKKVSVRISNHLKEVFANKISFYILGENTDYRKELICQFWSETERRRIEYRFDLVSRNHGEEFGVIELDRLKSSFAIETRSEWISRQKDKLESGEWERYFQKIVEFKAMYETIKAMEN